ncbi:hypothetical protein ID866_2564 [Astraeus odoratus]|nr:hypothetical protein ID866_2564 [Astraeus odoratus]
MLNKRKRDELDDSELSDEPTPGRQILPVANLPEDFDGVPMDGMQYLFLVRRDARRLPHITRVRNPYEGPAVPIAQDTPRQSSSDVLPSEKWQTAFQLHFRNLRKNLAQPTVRISVERPSLAQPLIPEKKDREAWWNFLAGHPESAWSPAARAVSRKTSKLSQRVQVHLQNTTHVMHGNDPSGSDVHQVTGVSGDILQSALDAQSAVQIIQTSSSGAATILREVTPNRLREIDPGTAIHLLMYFTHWINIHLQNRCDPSTTINNTHARWMFSLLTKVEEMVSADEMSLLRNLARACLEIVKTRRRADMKWVEVADSISDASCWMIFTAVASVWGQKDLWMDAEAALSRA